MEKETILTNRFCPGIGTPFFYAGRKEDITEYFLLLKDFKENPLHPGSHIHLLKGVLGIGKTSFLCNLKKQIKEEIPSYVCAYSHAMDFLDDPAIFYKNFWTEIEESFQGLPSRREALLKFLRKVGWQEKAMKIASGLIPLAYKFSLLDQKAPIKSLFKIFSETYLLFENLQEMFILLNWLLQELDLYFFWIIDHVEEIQVKPDIFALLASTLLELDKPQRRTFVTLALDDAEGDRPKSSEIQEAGALVPLLRRTPFLAIEANEQVASMARPFINRLQNLDKFAVINISPSLDIDTIARAMKGHCASQSVMLKFSAQTFSTLEEYFQEMSQKMLIEAKNALAKVTANYIFAQQEKTDSTQLLEDQLALVENNLDHVLLTCGKIFEHIDEKLQHFEDISLTVFFEDWEKFISPDLETGEDPSLLKKKTTLVYRTKFLALSINFFKAFYFLQNRIQSLKKISFVLLTKIPSHEFHAYDAKNMDVIYARAQAKELKMLPQDDSIHLLKETAARSGVIFSDTIAQDIFSRTEGSPLALQHFGHYVVSALEESFPLDEREFLRKSILRKYQSEHAKNTRLVEGPDGRVRILLDKKFYDSIVPANLNDLHQKKLSQLKHACAHDILYTFCEQEHGLETTQLTKKLQEKGLQISQDAMLVALQELKENQLIVPISEKSTILQPSLSAAFKKALAQGEKALLYKGLENSKKSKAPFLLTRKLPTAKEPPRPSPEEGEDLLRIAKESAYNGNIPDFKTLSYLSKKIVLEESAATFKSSMEYIRSICTLIQKKLQIPMDVLQIEAIFKSYLLVSQKQQGQIDLFFAWKKTLFGSKGLAKLYPQDFTLGKIYFLLYAVAENYEDLQKSLDFFFLCLKSMPLESTLLECFVELDRKLSLIDQAKNLEEVALMVKWLKSLLGIHDIDLMQNQLEEWTPSRIPREEHRIFLKFLEKLIQNQTFLMASAISLIGFYGNVIQEQQEIFYFLIECIEKDPALAEKAVGTLIRLFPYLKQADREEILVGIEEILMKNDDLRLLQNILSQSNQTFLLFPADSLATFFYDLWKREDVEAIHAPLWHCLMDLRPLCNTKGEQEMTSFLMYAYSNFWEIPMDGEDFRAYTASFLGAYAKSKEMILPALEKMVQVLKDYENGRWSPPMAALDMIYPLLSEEKAKDIRCLLEQWFLGGENQKKLFALEYFSYFYHNLHNGSETIALIFDQDFSWEQQVLLQNLLFCMPEIDLPTREYMGERLKKLWEITYSWKIGKRNSLVGARMILSSLLSLPSFYSIAEADALVEILEPLILSKDERSESIFIASVQRPHEFLPYMSTEGRDRIYSQCHKVLLGSGAKKLSTLLDIMLHCPMEEPLTEDQLSFLYEQMQKSPLELRNISLAFFTRIHKALSPKWIEKITADALSYMYYPQYAQAASIFLIQSKEEIPECMQWAYRYQWNPATSPIAFALYEIFPDTLNNTPNLLENYEKLRQKNPYLLGLKMADFHHAVGATERATELLSWILQYAKSPFIQEKALDQKRRWELCQYQGNEAHKTLEQMIAIHNRS